MKYICLFFIIIILSCNSQTSVSENQQNEFEKITRSYQSVYMEGGENCEQILAAIDEEIKMWENGKVWTYSDLEKFCNHLPEKEVIDTYNNQKLLNNNLGYDYVSQLYISQKGDTLRETASRIWERTDITWKIVQMNNLLKKE